MEEAVNFPKRSWFAVSESQTESTGVKKKDHKYKNLIKTLAPEYIGIFSSRGIIFCVIPVNKSFLLTFLP